MNMVTKIKSFIKKAVEDFSISSKARNRVRSWPIAYIFSYAIGITFLLEALNRRSFVDGLGYAIHNPAMFLYNALIVLFTLSLAELLKKKDFFLVLISVLWISLGVINFVVLGFRTTPLAAIDFHIIKSVLGIIHIYLNSFQIVIISIAVLLTLLGIGMAWKKLPKKQVYYRKAFVTTVALVGLMFTMPNLASEKVSISSNFGNLADAYEDYGFAYCFSTSVVDRGIKKPDGYNQSSIEEILSRLDVDETKKLKGIKPNIVMVQLESFFDVNYLNNMGFSENPVPNFTDLKEEYASGFLTVPSIGAGTANTEFEVLTGMSLDFFGAGEYPYKTILQESQSESIPNNLDVLGYKSHAIHNNTATFYDRNKVFANLGFDAFSSIEYMGEVSYSPIGWAKDKHLTEEILKAMKSTVESDFVFAISVQAHGKYPEVPVDVEQKISIQSSMEEGKKVAFEYYINQLYEVDQFIGTLIDTLNNFDESVVLVLYGDHLPSFDINNEDLDNHSRYQTEYIIWRNDQSIKGEKDLETYQLGSYVLGRTGINQGILIKLHQISSNSPSYQETLLMLQYDMLYGEKYVYNQEEPYKQKNLKMGFSGIGITQIKEVNDEIHIEGYGFTPWSKVYLNDKEIETVYMDAHTLFIKSRGLHEEDELRVVQQSDNKMILSQTEAWCFNRQIRRTK
ncbi:LTA synthase family protein [Petrocella sp. FN5]|uniref:LTA synthase family protein n=1 Tax=Petrocella sp. FN5 TaxID=3032002 RepID=UPI0023DCD442|nr:LTA synthase family protein [Petrocella sp. FN5]MDF1617204.1 LTA synthase family protein [Petrocella sp. FN5]